MAAMNRVSIIGTTGSGKSTLAAQLAHRLEMPCIELDAIHWQQPDWNPISREQFQSEVAEVVRAEQWVIEGGYSIVRPLIWTRADTILWLDYSFPVTFSRLLRRTTRRILRREALWGSNRETFQKTLSRDSILLWLLKTHGQNRQKFAVQLALPENQHLHVYRFDSPRQAEAWLNALPAGTKESASTTPLAPR